MSDANDDERPESPSGQGWGRWLPFAVGMLIGALIGSGTAVAWRTYSEPATLAAPGPPSGPISPAMQAPQETSNVENSQKIAEIFEAVQIDRGAFRTLETAQQTQAQQMTELRNQIAGLQAELQQLSAAFAAQKAAQKKAPAAATKRQAELGTAPAAAQKPPAQPTTGAPTPAH
jgi:hypothetical protein